MYKRQPYDQLGTWVFDGDKTKTVTPLTAIKELVGDKVQVIDVYKRQPMYNALTGGAANLGGKTWVFDQYHDGHFGVGPAKGGGDYDGTPKWWSCLLYTSRCV